MRFTQNRKITLLSLGLAVIVATALAAVPGIFTTINATTGYLMNGAGGSSGQAICSDGTYFDTPCTPTGTGISALTGPVTASGTGSVASTITATGVTATSYLGANITVNAAGQVTAATSGAYSFTGTSGYQKLPSGLILQWGSTGSITNDTPTGVNFPESFPTAALSVTCSDVFAGSKSAIWSCYSWTTSGFTGRPDTNNATAQYVAIGY